VAAICWTAENTIACAGALLGRMLGAGSGLPLPFQRAARDKCQRGPASD
jgi:hypothetical protein